MANKKLTPDEDIKCEMMEGIPGFRNIYLSPKTKEMSGRKLIWPEIRGTIDDKFEMIALDTSNIDQVEQTAKIYRLGFPELFGGVYEDLHFPARYNKLTEQMKILLLQDMQNGRVASSWALTPSEINMSVEFSLAVTDPDYRGQGLCREFTRRVDKLVGEAGVELGFVYCAAFHKTTQKIFQELGFEKQGFLKGFILANVGEGKYARDHMVIFTKFYNDAEMLCPLEIQNI